MRPQRRIASRDNPVFRELRDIAASARERRRQGASLIEGVHLCEAFLARYGGPRIAAVTEAALAHPEVSSLLQRLEPPPVLLDETLFAALSAVEHGVGILFLIDTPRPALPATLDEDAVYLDRLQDPGNVGTVLRTCAAVGLRRVITAPGTAWCWSPKVLRAGMGAHFHLDVHESVPWSEVGPRLRVEARATTAGAPHVLFDADLRPAALWLFGREGDGLAPPLRGAGVLELAIPQAAAVESLNVGVAAAVCLYEQLRQRRMAR